MNAILVSAPFTASFADISLEQLGPNDVRVRVLAVGLCGTDLEIFEGSMPYFTAGIASYPIIPGHEWVGEIVELGSQVRVFQAGDRVVGECSIGCMKCGHCRLGSYHRCETRTETGILNRNGAFADFIRFPAAFLHRISRDVPPETACLVEPAAVAFNGVRMAGVSPADDVAVFGDGPIGLLLLQIARAYGARSVVVVGLSSERLEIARKLGADAVVNATEKPQSLALKKVMDAHPTVVLEATGNPAAIVSAINTAAPGARIVLQGLFVGQSLTGVRLDRIVTSELSIQGALGSPGVWPSVISLIESGRIDLAGIISHRLPLTAFEDAFSIAKNRRGVKVVLIPEN